MTGDYTHSYAREPLPELLPTDPFPLFVAWFEQARKDAAVPNPNAMALGTVDEQARPSVRTVLCKAIEPNPGYLVFHTNYNARKSRDLAANPAASVLFHWDYIERQVRIEGTVVRSPKAESDAYFRTRPLLRRLGAWASHQSEPLESPDQLMTQVAQVVERFDLSLEQLAEAADLSSPASAHLEIEIPRPPHWGGFRLYARQVELWQGDTGRLHDRALWSRTLGEDLTQTPWTSTRLQP
jgi:pyridoxamine 5'-phosphate oxidase